MSLSVSLTSFQIACENIRFSSLFVAKRPQRRRARRNGCFRRIVFEKAKLQSVLIFSEFVHPCFLLLTPSFRVFPAIRCLFSLVFSIYQGEEALLAENFMFGAVVFQPVCCLLPLFLIALTLILSKMRVYLLLLLFFHLD